MSSTLPSTAFGFINAATTGIVLGAIIGSAVAVIVTIVIDDDTTHTPISGGASEIAL